MFLRRLWRKVTPTNIVQFDAGHLPHVPGEFQFCYVNGVTSEVRSIVPSILPCVVSRTDCMCFLVQVMARSATFSVLFQGAEAVVTAPVDPERLVRFMSKHGQGIPTFTPSPPVGPEGRGGAGGP